MIGRNKFVNKHYCYHLTVYNIQDMKLVTVQIDWKENYFYLSIQQLKIGQYF